MNILDTRLFHNNGLKMIYEKNISIELGILKGLFSFLENFHSFLKMLLTINKIEKLSLDVNHLCRNVTIMD